MPNCRPFVTSSSPLSDLSQLAGSTATSYRIQALSIENDTIFIHSNIGAFVVVCSEQVPAESLMSTLGEKLGVKGPNFIVYCCFHDQYKKLNLEIERFMADDEKVWQLASKILVRPFYRVEEYVVGVSLWKIPPARFKEDVLSSLSLIKLGRAVAFDLLIGHRQRFRNLWEIRKGNLIQAKLKKYQTLHSTRNNSESIILTANGDWCIYPGRSSEVLMNNQNQNQSKGDVQWMSETASLLIDFISSSSTQVTPRRKMPLVMQALRIDFMSDANVPMADNDLVFLTYGILASLAKFIELWLTKEIALTFREAYLSEANIGNPNTNATAYWSTEWNVQIKAVSQVHLNQMFQKLSAIFSSHYSVVENVIESVSKIEGKRAFQQSYHTVSRQQSRASSLRGNTSPEELKQVDSYLVGKQSASSKHSEAEEADEMAKMKSLFSSSQPPLPQSSEKKPKTPQVVKHVENRWRDRIENFKKINYFDEEN